jgi:hypothetical protein
VACLRCSYWGTSPTASSEFVGDKRDGYTRISTIDPSVLEKDNALSQSVADDPEKPHQFIPPHHRESNV